MEQLSEAGRIDGLLHQKYGEDPWFYLSQVPERTGGGCRTIDALAINVWRSKLAVIAFEIKTSRSDFTREIIDPSKRQPFVDTTTEFYYVVPSGLVSPDEVPAECGLMYAEKTRLKRVKIAQQRKLETISPRFFRSVIRQMGRAKSVAYEGMRVFRFAGQAGRCSRAGQPKKNAAYPLPGWPA